MVRAHAGVRRVMRAGGWYGDLGIASRWAAGGLDEQLVVGPARSPAVALVVGVGGVVEWFATHPHRAWSPARITRCSGWPSSVGGTGPADKRPINHRIRAAEVKAKMPLDNQSFVASFSQSAAHRHRGRPYSSCVPNAIKLSRKSLRGHRFWGSTQARCVMPSYEEKGRCGRLHSIRFRSHGNEHGAEQGGGDVTR
jgi:hypothetical protein